MHLQEGEVLVSSARQACNHPSRWACEALDTGSIKATISGNIDGAVEGPIEDIHSGLDNTGPRGSRSGSLDKVTGHGINCLAPTSWLVIFQLHCLRNTHSIPVMSHVMIPALPPRSSTVSSAPRLDLPDLPQTEVSALQARIITLEARVQDQGGQIDALLRLHEGLQRQVAARYPSFPLVDIDRVLVKMEPSPMMAGPSLPHPHPPRSPSPIDHILDTTFGVAHLTVDPSEALHQLPSLIPHQNAPHTPPSHRLQDIDPAQSQPITASPPPPPHPPLPIVVHAIGALTSLVQYDNDDDIEMHATDTTMEMEQPVAHTAIEETLAPIAVEEPMVPIAIEETVTAIAIAETVAHPLTPVMHIAPIAIEEAVVPPSTPVIADLKSVLDDMEV